MISMKFEACGVKPGDHFGSLLVIGRPFRDGSLRRRWQVVCWCKCGKSSIVNAENLKRGLTNSCGCERTKHGLYKDRIYGVWGGMLNRCESETSPGYSNYGGRGISVCKEWHDASVFAKWAKSTGYRKGLQIDRIDNNGNYEPSNCRWATVAEQARNRRSNRIVTAFGETKCASEWSRDARCAITYDTLLKRLNSGCDAEMSISRSSPVTST